MNALTNTGHSAQRIINRTATAKQFAALLFIISVIACPIAATNLISADPLSAAAQSLTITGVAIALITAAVAIETERHYTTHKRHGTGTRAAIITARVIFWIVLAATATLATAALALLSNWTLR